MRTIEAFPAMWYKCPTCDAENAFRYSLVEQRQPASVCCGCGKRWLFEEMARATFSLHGFHPFPTQYFRAATDFICDDCGRENTVINAITRQMVAPVNGEEHEPWSEENESQMMMALQEVEDITEADCKFCGARFALEFEIPQVDEDGNPVDKDGQDL